jgi:hypothetical protein
MSEAQTVEALQDVLKKHQAAASDKETLALKPNSAADATEGAHPQISPTAYVTWTRPDGGTFIAPLSNSETYERNGFKKGAEQEIPDLVAYLAEQAGKDPEAPKEPKEPTPAAPKTATTTTATPAKPA